MIKDNGKGPLFRVPLLADYLADDVLTVTQFLELREAIKNRNNILVSGIDTFLCEQFLTSILHEQSQIQTNDRQNIDRLFEDRVLLVGSYMFHASDLLFPSLNIHTINEPTTKCAQSVETLVFKSLHSPAIQMFDTDYPQVLTIDAQTEDETVVSLKNSILGKWYTLQLNSTDH